MASPFLTPDQIAANRALAVQTVRAAQGLTNIAPVDWTYDQRTAYNHALADYIATNANQFSDQDNLNAQLIASTNYQPLADSSFDWATFAVDTAKPVTAAAQSIGNGVLSVANAAQWVIPILAIVAVLVVAEKLSGGTAISTVKKLASK